MEFIGFKAIFYELSLDKCIFTEYKWRFDYFSPLFVPFALERAQATPVVG
jgi:hypothetical protein